MSVKNPAAQLNGHTVSAVSAASNKAKGTSRDMVQRFATVVDEVLLPNLTRTQALLLAGLAVGQGLLRRNQKKASQNLGSVQNMVTNKTQTGLAKTQDVALMGLSTAQSAVQSGLSTAQDVLQKNVKRVRKDRRFKAAQKAAQARLSTAQGVATSGLSTAQNVLEKNLKSARKSQKKAQKSIRGVKKSGMQSLATTQDALQSSLGAAQGVLEKNLRSARKDLRKNVKKTQKNLKKAGASVQDLQDSASRSASKFLFRLGIVVGLVAILLYTPWPGSETRQKLAELWQQVRENVSTMRSAF